MKKIFLAVSATFATVTLLMSLFFNSILGVFGLAATSVTALQNLKNSQQVVDKMKARHAKRKHEVSKRHSKKAGKRIASTALAAATIGTLAVTATVVGLEVNDYCEERQALQEEENLLYGSDVAFDWDLCVQQGLEDSKSLWASIKEESAGSLAGMFEATREFSAERWARVQEAGEHTADFAAQVAGRFWRDNAQ
ncbi:MAG: hypothetical protein WBN40_03430 [Pseudomonadales bacterium]